MNDEQWEEVLQEIRDAVPCPPEDCPSCDIADLCRYLRACASPSEAK